MTILRPFTLLLLLVSGQDPAAVAPPADTGEGPRSGEIGFALEEPFRGDGLTIQASKRVGGYAAFDVVAADMDLDDDLDVFINWHLGGIELCENTGDELVVLNVPDADVSGLGDQPGVPSLFALRGAAPGEPGDEWPAGVHIWHENALVWSLCLVPPAEGPTLPLEIRSNETFGEVDGLEPGESVHRDREGVTVSLVPGRPARLLHLRHAFPSADLRLSQPAETEAPWPYHVGRLPSTLETPAISLRKPDPHGVAWVQAIGSAGPELIIIRGGNRGTLAPPDPPKSNRVFVHTGEHPDYVQLDPALAPRDHARGRSAEWVDVDNDGVNELSIGNKNSPNALWFLEPDENRFRDRAADLQLDHRDGDASAWFDIDADGLQDQLLVNRNLLVLSHNRGAEGFASRPVHKAGLDLGGPFEERTAGISRTSISVFDIDSDGDLDVWVSSVGAARFHRIFRRDGNRFTDVTAALGLDGLDGSESTIRLDVDDDGYIDVLVLGVQPLLLWNRGGERFEQVPLQDVVPGLPTSSGPGPGIFAAAAGDMDADGRTDLVLIGQSRQVAFNRSRNDNQRLLVHLRADTLEPIGALVRLHTDDGRSLVQRYGSAHRSFASQSLQPLHFGIAAGTAVTMLEVLWPGETEWTACELPTGGEVWLAR